MPSHTDCKLSNVMPVNLGADFPVTAFGFHITNKYGAPLATFSYQSSDEAEAARTEMERVIELAIAVGIPR